MENVEQCDFLIETTCEDLHLKHQTLQKFEESLPEHCIFAFNTSVLSIDQIATQSRRPDKVTSVVIAQTKTSLSRILGRWDALFLSGRQS